MFSCKVRWYLLIKFIAMKGTMNTYCVGHVIGLPGSNRNKGECFLGTRAMQLVLYIRHRNGHIIETLEAFHKELQDL